MPTFLPVCLAIGASRCAPCPRKETAMQNAYAPAFSPVTLTVSKWLRGVRPAALASFLGRLCGLMRRQPCSTPNGSFAILPVSQFGGLLLEKGEYEPGMVAVLKKYLKPGNVFVDLGTNEGYFSVIASGLVGSKGKVISVEPQSRLQTVIQTNLDLNRCANVTLLQMLVSGTDGELGITLTPAINSGASSLYTGHQKLSRAMATERVT